jgi:hypothetical protein
MLRSTGWAGDQILLLIRCAFHKRQGSPGLPSCIIHMRTYVLRSVYQLCNTVIGILCCRLEVGSHFVTGITYEEYKYIRKFIQEIEVPSHIPLVSRRDDVMDVICRLGGVRDMLQLARLQRTGDEFRTVLLCGNYHQIATEQIVSTM